MTRFLLWLVQTALLLQLTGCGHSLTPDSIVARARSYSDLRWAATESNRAHGIDRNGIRVDTPDRAHFDLREGWHPGRVNIGMPYKWGGFDTPESFRRKIARGAPAGDVYTREKRQLLDAAVSREAAGIDCSGFISRCWGLSRHHSTRELPSLCRELKGFDELQPGDILNIHNDHVLLFEDFVDARRELFFVFETSCDPDWRVVRHIVIAEELERLGYRPYRYRRMW